MQSILFAIIIGISMNIQPAKAQLAGVKEEKQSGQAEKLKAPSNQHAITELLKTVSLTRDIEKQLLQIAIEFDTQAEKVHQERAKLKRARKTAVELVQEIWGADQIEEKISVIELTKVLADAIKTGDVKRYLLVSDLMEEYGYIKSEVITSALSAIPSEEELILVKKLFVDKHPGVFKWMWMMINAESNKKFFTLEMIRILFFAIASDIKHLHVYRNHYIVPLQETAKKTGNHSALKLLGNVDDVLNMLKENDNKKAQLTKNVLHTLLNSYSEARRDVFFFGGISVLYLAASYSFLFLSNNASEIMASSMGVMGVIGGVLAAAIPGLAAAARCSAAFQTKKSIKTAKKAVKALSSRN